MQHLPDIVGHDGTRRRRASSPSTTSTIEPGHGSARLARRRTRRSSRTIIRASAGSARGCARPRTPTTARVEAVEDPDRRFAVGVLWHPEAGEDLKLFEALVGEAGRYRDERH